MGGVAADVGIFGTLLVIAVYDAREHRIPNKWVLLLMLLALVMKLNLNSVHDVKPIDLLKDLGSGGLFFLFGFSLYLLKAMAPGDVKLLGGIGFLIGWNHMMAGLSYLGVAMIVVGAFYFLYFRAQTCHASFLSSARDYFSRNAFRPVSTYIFFRQYKYLNKQLSKQSDIVYRMPFAPVIALGIALYQYYGG